MVARDWVVLAVIIFLLGAYWSKQDQMERMAEKYNIPYEKVDDGPPCGNRC